LGEEAREALGDDGGPVVEGEGAEDGLHQVGVDVLGDGGDEGEAVFVEFFLGVAQGDGLGGGAGFGIGLFVVHLVESFFVRERRTATRCCLPGLNQVGSELHPMAALPTSKADDVYL
jgi:hypothetical protein